MSCEEPFDIDLDDAEPKIVIEAWLTDHNQPACMVRLRKSQAYFDTSAPEIVRDASVILTDLTSGATDTLRVQNEEKKPHVYKANKDFEAQAGHTYKLEVYAEGQYFYAQTAMRPMTAVDSLTTDVRIESDETDPEFVIYWNGQEPAERGQTYFAEKHRIQKGSRFLRVEDIYQDKFVNGRYLRFPVYDLAPDKAGDTVVVTIGSLTNPIYDYFRVAKDLGNGFGGPLDPIPNNPPTNIQGGALGYFMASSIYRDTFIVDFGE